jgi:hypothetical protein
MFIRNPRTIAPPLVTLVRLGFKGSKIFLSKWIMSCVQISVFLSRFQKYKHALVTWQNAPTKEIQKKMILKNDFFWNNCTYLGAFRQDGMFIFFKSTQKAGFLYMTWLILIKKNKCPANIGPDQLIVQLQIQLLSPRK